jgi:hypothetical protein
LLVNSNHEALAIWTVTGPPRTEHGVSVAQPN